MERPAGRPAPPTFHITTLGCRTNIYDSALLSGILISAGFRPSPCPESARVLIVNTCSVTGRSDRESRRLFRRFRRLNPGAILVGTGCFCRLFPDLAKENRGPDILLKPGGEDEIVPLLMERLGGGGVPPIMNIAGALMRPTPSFRTRRAFLKIQEGCDSVCAYCIVPRARGPSRSLPKEGVIYAFRSLAPLHPEIVLCGTRLGEWGKGEGHADLLCLLDALLSEPFPVRIRLSSIEPMDLRSGVIGLMEREKRLCSHLHLPLQTGCDTLLEKMGRDYRREDFRLLIEEIRGRVPDAGIGVDLIAGLPGEGEMEFDETLQFIRSLPVTYLHVFPYSERPYTRAPSLPGRVPERVRKERVKALLRVSGEKRRSFVSSLIGKREFVILERRRGKGYTGLTSNYVRVYVEPPGRPPSPFAEVEIRGVGDGDGRLALARVVDYFDRFPERG